MNRRYENPQTVNMNNLLTDSVLINTLLTHMKQDENKEETPPLPVSAFLKCVYTRAEMIHLPGDTILS